MPATEDPERRGAYPICWPIQLGPPEPSGVPVTAYVRTHGERDEQQATQHRLLLDWRRLREPDFDPRRFHIHHVVPLFLGGPDNLRTNATLIERRQHLRGHDVLRFQPQMITPPPGLPPLGPDLYRHSVGTRYYLAGYKSEAHETCE
jgi:hypothetical protein